MAKAKAKKAATKTVAKPELTAKEAAANLTAFLKANKLSRDEDHSKNKKFGAEYKALVAAVESFDKKESDKPAKSKAKGESAKDDKPAKAKAAGKASERTTYDYPDGLTSAEKKQYRVLMRKGKSPKEALEGVKAAPAKDAAPAKKGKAKEEEAPKKKSKEGGKKEVASAKTKKAKKGKKKVKSND